MNEVAKRAKPRLIQGVIAKCVDGRWADSDGLPLPNELVVVGITRALQCWKDQYPVDTIIEQPGEPLPDVDELNAKIPQNEWELGLDNKPRPPWQLNYVVYLLNPATADTYTFLNSTIGARIAFERLSDKFHWMRKLRGLGVVPLVKLDSRPMKTDFGQKMRPEFTILDWGDIETAPGIKQQETPQIEQQKPASDSTPTNTSNTTTKIKFGKPVKPVTLAEEIDDDLPEFLKP
jgi:hypothetical protein